MADSNFFIHIKKWKEGNMKEDLWELKQPTQKVVEYLDGVTVDGKNIEFVSDVQAKLVSENLVEMTIKFFAKDYKLVTGYLNPEHKYDFLGIDKKEEGINMKNKLDTNGIGFGDAVAIGIYYKGKLLALIEESNDERFDNNVEIKMIKKTNH